MLYNIIKEPLITEKSSFDRTQNKYVFKVRNSANKTEIKKAVEKIFNVKVQDVNTLKVLGKGRRHGKVEGKDPDWKKAIVTIKAGQTIESLGA